MSNNRKVFSSLLTIKNTLKRAKFNNFLGGLIFGAIFSLAVNIVTLQIQEVINQQLYLESLELEIAGHNIDALNRLESINKISLDTAIPNIYIEPIPYRTRVWENSDGLRYLVKLDSNIQSEVIPYYDFTVWGQNSIMEKDFEITKDMLAGCYVNDYESASEAEKLLCREKYFAYLNRDILAGKNMVEVSSKVLKNFHPTKDRLSNPMLKLLIGDKSVKFLQ